MINYVSIGSTSNSGIIYNDEHTVQVSENWSNNKVYVQIDTPAKIGEKSSSRLYSLGLNELNDLFALMVSMKLIDISNIVQIVEEIDAKTNSNQLNLKFQ